MGSSEGVLVDPPLFHDELEVLLRVAQQRDVPEWVAVKENKITVGPRLDDAERARLIGMPLAARARRSALSEVAWTRISYGE